MKTITISGVISKNGMQSQFDERGEVKSVSFQFGVVTGIGDKQQRMIATVNCYGREAAAALEITTQHATVTGEFCINKDTDGARLLMIDRASVSPSIIGANVNSLAIAGRLSDDPEVNHFGEKTKVRLTIPVNRTKEVTDWCEIELWNKIAGIAEQYLHKSDYAAVSGRLSIERYATQSGEPRTRLACIADKLTLCGKSVSSNPNTNQVKNYNERANSTPVGSTSVDDDWDF